jgi:hypothetical protein
MYILLLILITASLVATAAYFSVIGIASVFAYNYIAALILGAALEAAKVAMAVYLYRYWRLIPTGFRSLLVGFMVVLMFITSVGIFGFLSQGYQKTAEEYKVMTLELKNLENEYAEKKTRMGQINRQINEVPTDSVRNKIRLSREFGDEVGELRERIAVIEPRIQELRVKSLTYESHIGPISYVARMLEVPQDKIVFMAILMLVFVADPLAVTLTVACNMALIRFLGTTTSSGRVRAMAPIMPGVIDRMVSKAQSIAMLSYSSTFGDRKESERGRRTKAKPTAKKTTKARRGR